MIDQQKVVESLNVIFDDTKHPSLQREKESESLEFENLSDNYLGEGLHVVATEVTMSNVNEASGPSGGSIGNNTVTQHSAETTGHSGGASNSPSINSGGANEEGSASRHTQHNYEFGESSRANLPRSSV